MKKRNIAGVLCALAFAAVLTNGCSGRKAQEFTPQQDGIFLKEDGTIYWASVTEAAGADLTKEGLTAFVEEQVSGYNASLGKEAAAYNTEGKETLPVSVVSCELGEGRASLVLGYDRADRLLEFAEEIGDDTIPFDAITVSRAGTMTGEIRTLSFIDEKGNEISGAEVAEKGELLAMRTEGQGIDPDSEKILYVSKGTEFKDAHTAVTANEGASFLIIK